MVGHAEEDDDVPVVALGLREPVRVMHDRHQARLQRRQVLEHFHDVVQVIHVTPHL